MEIILGNRKYDERLFKILDDRGVPYELVDEPTA